MMANIFTCPVTLGNVKLLQTGETKLLFRRPTGEFHFASEATAFILSRLCSCPEGLLLSASTSRHFIIANPVFTDILTLPSSSVNQPDLCFCLMVLNVRAQLSSERAV